VVKWPIRFRSLRFALKVDSPESLKASFRKHTGAQGFQCLWESLPSGLNSFSHSCFTSRTGCRLVAGFGLLLAECRPQMNPRRSSGSLVYGSPGGQFRAGAGIGAIQCGSPVCGVVSLAAVGAGWGLGFWVSVLTHLRAKRNRHPKETVMRKLSFQKRHRKHTFSMSLH